MALSLNIASQSLEYQIGGTAPTAQSLVLNFGGNFSTQYPTYSNFRIKYYIDSTNVTLSGDDVSTLENEIDILGSQANIDINFNNLDTLPSQNTIYISFVLEGYTDEGEIGTGIWRAIDFIDHILYINVNPEISILPNKYIYEIQYLKTTGTFSGDTVISLLNNTAAENCSVQLTQSAQYFAIQDASFATSTNIIAGVDLAQLATVTSNPLGIQAVLKNSAGVAVANFSLKVSILENDDITANINELEFELVKSKSETKTATFNLANPSGKAFTITAPSFLTVSPSSGSSAGTITVNTVNSSTLNIGDYSGNIVITFDTTKTVTIPVSLLVINFFRSQLSSDFNFCLDKKLMKFYKIDAAGVFVRANLTITFKTPLETKTVERSYVVPYLEGKAEMDLGAILQTYYLKYIYNILAEANVPNFFNAKLWYHPVTVSGNVEELDADYQVKNSEALNNLKFFAGKKPLAYPVLTNNLIRRRSADSKVIFSYITGATDINDFGADFTNYAVLPEKVAAVLKTETADQLFTWPTVKQFNIGVNPIKIITMPNNNQHINVAFFNSNLVPDWLTITGDYRIYDDYTHTISRNVISGNEEKFDSDKTKALSLNSGFILRTEIDILDELAESRMIFLEIDGEYYRGILTTNKINKKDSTEELISRELEFLIVKA